MRIVMLAAVLVVGFNAGAQHGKASDPQAHFEEIAERLELTKTQRETLAEPFRRAFHVMQELHRLHDEISAELTDEQKSKLAEMIHTPPDGSASRHAHPHH